MEGERKEGRYGGREGRSNGVQAGRKKGAGFCVTKGAASAGKVPWQPAPSALPPGQQTHSVRARARRVCIYAHVAQGEGQGCRPAVWIYIPGQGSREASGSRVEVRARAQ